eukprot:SAG31_NODE_5475_length_2518_cov_1.939231_1_plen_237_part_00
MSVQEETEAFKQAQDMIKGPDKQLDAKEMLSVGQSMLGSVTINAEEISSKLAESETLTKFMKADSSGEVLKDGMALLSGKRTAEEAVAAILENDAFLEQVKAVVVSYIEDSVMGAEIPEISGKKDWGTYEIKGLTIESIEISPQQLQVDVSRGVEITVGGVVAKFSDFSWNYDKQKFPKMKDEGATCRSDLATVQATYLECRLICQQGRRLLLLIRSPQKFPLMLSHLEVYSPLQT